MPNRLAQETSPYLLQHADNPVDWYPWGEEALERAKNEDRPVLLSVGYSSCHWCHVMERESFEDEQIARLMNENFVNIKVDREERPDIDSLYMSALQAMTRSGGWPMTVFLTPEGAPFYAGTYFPPAPRGGLPSFRQVLATLADAYENRREDIAKSADGVREFLEAQATAEMPRTSLRPELLEHAGSSLLSQIDRENGGFGGAPKFPQPMNLEVLLRRHARAEGEEDPEALAAVELTLKKMAAGGIHDHLGGGFARYSVDERWLVPHFEKMLYDNALLARLYTEVYQATGDPLYRRVAEDTLDYLLRDLRDPAGGLYCAEDADSEGVEGKFYVWMKEEIEEVLGPEEAPLAHAYWGVTESGNFEGKNILNVPRSPGEVAEEFEISARELERRVEVSRQRLFTAREERVRPARDDKVLAAWNGLALRSLALASRVFGREDYLEAARENADFLIGTMKEDGRLLRSYRDGEARIGGYLEDYASVADGLISLYEADFDARWLREAAELADTMDELFWDAERGAYYDTPEDHEKLVARPRDLYDNAAPSGNSLAAEALLRLAILTAREDYRARAEAILEGVSGAMEQLPAAFGRALAALDFHLSKPKEIAIVGEEGSPDTEALLDAVYSAYLPNRVIASSAPDDEEAARHVPLLEDRPLRDGRATAYVCEGYVCQSPTTNAEEMLDQLNGG